MECVSFINSKSIFIHWFYRSVKCRLIPFRADIESEDKFPSDYLENVTGKIANSTAQLENIKIALNKLKENINYQVSVFNKFQKL